MNEQTASAALPPWERLKQNSHHLERMESRIEGTVHPLAVVSGVLQLGKGSVIKPGCVIEGHVRVGEDCVIGPNAYLRGNVHIGRNCVIGNAVEIKSSILGDHVCVAHLTYIGDSVLENDINIGGGCILSNFRHDAGEIRMPWNGVLCATGCRKLGCYIGSHSRIGSKCVILPGRVLPECSQTYPGSVISMSKRENNLKIVNFACKKDSSML